MPLMGLVWTREAEVATPTAWLVTVALPITRVSQLFSGTLVNSPLNAQIHRRTKRYPSRQNYRRKHLGRFRQYKAPQTVLECI